MGTKSKGRIVEITLRNPKKDDVYGQPTFKSDFVRTKGSGRCKNIPPQYDPTKMKVIPRSKR